MNMFKPTTAKTTDECINMIAEPRRSDIKKLHELIQKLLPKEKPHILYGVIGYGSYPYKSASGGRRVVAHCPGEPETLHFPLCFLRP